MNALTKLEEKDLKMIKSLEKKLGQDYEIEKDEYMGQIIFSVIVAEDFHCQRDEIYSDEMRETLNEVEKLISVFHLDERCENCDYYDCDEFIGIEIIFQFNEGADDGPSNKDGKMKSDEERDELIEQILIKVQVENQPSSFTVEELDRYEAWLLMQKDFVLTNKIIF